jgi:glycosyltransferase involved in cell wall biosynthesis
MNILHLCSDYARQKLYLELIRGLSKKGLSQFIYIPVRTAGELNRYKDTSIANATWQYSHILSRYLKFFYRKKLRIKERDLSRYVDYSSFSMIHAHFLFSDGGLAYNLKKKHNVPYITAVRNTDINYFFKYAIHLRKWGLEVLLNAERIIFISPTYQQQLLTSYVPAKYHSSIIKKSLIIPNGVDPFWLQNRWTGEKKKLGDPVKLLYVGEFTKNKNLDSSIDACEKLQREGFNLTLTLVGEYGGYESKIKKRVAGNPRINTLRKITDKTKLLECYRAHDIFIMPSFYETFGLVYIEALTQKLPIIYSRNQGIDGYFRENEAGYGVNSRSVDDIAGRITDLVKNYDHFANSPPDLTQFSWDHVSARYYGLYTSVI